MAIRGDVGWTDPDVRRKLEMIRMWDRLVNTDNSRLTKRVFLWDYNQPHGWCSDMKKIFSSIGLNNLYETISINNFQPDHYYLLRKLNSKLTNTINGILILLLSQNFEHMSK